LNVESPEKPEDFGVGGRSHTVEVAGSNPAPPNDFRQLLSDFQLSFRFEMV
jgi:hypothetical protein